MWQVNFIFNIGLGRAPVLIAIALIEHGMANLDAVDFIREKRRGAFNNLQIVYIDRYKRILTKDSDKGWFKSFVGKLKPKDQKESKDITNSGKV